jgi:hypothetical protein
MNCELYVYKKIFIIFFNLFEIYCQDQNRQNNHFQGSFKKITGMYSSVFSG